MNKCSCGARDKEKCINESSHGYGKMCMKTSDNADKYLVIDDKNHIYFNEFSETEEEIMDYRSALYLADALNGSQPICKVMKLVEVK